MRLQQTVSFEPSMGLGKDHAAYDRDPTSLGFTRWHVSLPRKKLSLRRHESDSTEAKEESRGLLKDKRVLCGRQATWWEKGKCLARDPFLDAMLDLGV